MRPKEHLLDTYGRLLRAGNVYDLRQHFDSRIALFTSPGKTKAEARALATNELYDLRYGPTKITVYNVLLAYTVMRPTIRREYLDCAKWLIETAKVPVDGEDLSGTNILSHAISTQPYLDIEFADLMLTAGAHINHRNRYGYTAAHDIANVMWLQENARKKAAMALQWFLEKGGNVDIKDGDRISARDLIQRFGARTPELAVVLEKTDQGLPQTVDHGPTRVSRNAPCPCGSRRKYKKCCGKD